MTFVIFAIAVPIAVALSLSPDEYKDIASIVCLLIYLSLIVMLKLRHENFDN